MYPAYLDKYRDSSHLSNETFSKHFKFVTIYEDDLLVTVAKQCFAYFMDGSAFTHVSRQVRVA